MKRNVYPVFTCLIGMVSVMLLSTCTDDDEDPQVRPEPTVTFEGGADQATRFWDEDVDITAGIDAQAGLKSLVVSKNGADFETIEYPVGRAGDQYTVDDVIGDTETIGAEIVYTLTATDRLDRTASASFTITVGLPAAPEITFTAVNSALVRAGDSVDISLNLTAPARIEDLFISRDGSPFDTVSFSNDNTQALLTYKAPVDAALMVGEQVIYSFELTDQLDRKTEAIDFTIEIGTPAPTFIIKDTVVATQTYRLVRGNINLDTVFKATDPWLLSGVVEVSNGITLTIEEGTTVYADTTGVTALAVQTEGGLIAEGSLANPIIFTSLNDNPAHGDWGGIHINGLAPVTSTNASLVAVIGEYGGTNSVDNSGVLKYVRVEYAGKSVGGSTGALNFNAVGDQTTLDFIQVYSPNSRGIRFRGGKANLKHAVVTDPATRAVVWEDAWVGFGQFWVVTYSAEPPSNDTAIEGRDAESDPTISNVTVLSLGGTAFNNTRGVRFRNNTHGRMYNAIVTATERGVRADTGSDVDINNGDLIFAHSRVYDNPEGNYRNDADLFENAAFNNSITPVTLNGYVGSDTDGALDPTGLDPWFSAGSYIGAVETGNDWTSGWIRE